MFISISWSTYLIFIAVSALIYYAFVFYTYYRHDLLMNLKGKQVLTRSVQFTADGSMQSAVPVAITHEDYQLKTEKADPPQILQAFTDEVKAYIEEAGNKETEKEILLQCLSVIAGKYPSLAQSEYRESLDQFIITETEMNCAVFLSDSEVRRVWGGT